MPMNKMAIDKWTSSLILL